MNKQHINEIITNAIVLVMDGSDCSFKETNTKALYDKLVSMGYKVVKLSYPDYDSSTSTLVKMYLGKEFGDKPEDVNPYIASAFYAVDRIGSFLKNWKEQYNSGEKVIYLLDRYVTSNMIHQASKIENVEERAKYLDWLYDLEYIKFGLPIPDEVIFLNMPYENSLEIMKERDNKITGESSKDLHEGNPEFIRKSYENACWIADKYAWKQVMCVTDETEESGLRKYKSREDILEEIYSKIKHLL